MVTLTIAPPCPMLLHEAGSRRGRLQGTDGRMINRRTGSGKRARNPAGSRFKPGEPLILPVHDSLVLEAPLPVLREAAELTRVVLTQTVQERFPEMRPRADVNIKYPGCWNDDGRHDSLERFLEDPLRTP